MIGPLPQMTRPGFLLFLLFSLALASAPVAGAFVAGGSPGGAASPPDGGAGPAGLPAVDGAWNELLPPTGRVDHSAIHDPARGRMVVFGGVRFDSPTFLNDVWVLSLSGAPQWTPLTPSGTPPTSRREHTAIYDPVRDRMIVFGGFASSTPNYRNDVWALSLGGSPGWTQLAPSGTPPAGRRNHAAVYDPVGDRMIVFGGSDGTDRNDVWALSLAGTPTWTQLSPSGTPPTPRSAHSAIYDAAQPRVIVFGGNDGTYRADVWALTLSPAPAWTQLTPSGFPPDGRADHAAIYDPVGQRMIVFGEWDGRLALINEVYALSLGATPEWSLISPTTTRAAGRWGHTAVYDPDLERMIVFGGLPNYANDAWAFSLDGSAAWTELSPITNAPSGRWFHAAAYDAVRDRVVITGGYPNNVHDAWTLNLGGQPGWTRLNTSGASPAGRKNHSAIYHPIRDRVVVFGGFLTYPDDVGLVLYQNDTWMLSTGAIPEWTEVHPSGTPPDIRDEHSAIYDPLRDRMIVFGGHRGYFNYNDVWALSLGETLVWTQLFPAGTPPVGRRRHNAIYDPLRDRMVVFGGYDTPGLSCLNDVWALSLGENPAWTQLTPSGTPPSPRGRQCAVHDPLRDRMVVFGGYDCAPGFRNDTWALSLQDPPAWTQLAPSGTLPSVRGGATTTYDPLRDRMIVIGGAGSYQLNDVWELTWGAGACAVPEIASYTPSLLTPANCDTGCTVDFVVDTEDDYSAVTMITLERYVEGEWMPEDTLSAPLPLPAWTLSCEVDEYFTDGEHVFRAVFHCGSGPSGLSQTVTVVADRWTPVGIGGRGSSPAAPVLHQNAPNPFNPSTSISFFLPARARVSLRVYDVQGRLVRTLIDAEVDGGDRSTRWDGRDERGNSLSSGVYFYQLRFEDKTLTRKMVLLK